MRDIGDILQFTGTESTCAQPDQHKIWGPWGGHCKFARWLVERLKPQNFVELGSYCGCSFFAFCQAVHFLKERSPKINTTCVAVDHWRGDVQSGMYGENVYEMFTRTLSQYEDFATGWRMSFDEAHAVIAKGMCGGGPCIDILHIDGCHTYEAVSHDFEKWLPLVRGVVLLHDTDANLPTFGVGKVFEHYAIVQEVPSFRFLHSFGLGVLDIGHVLPDLTNRGSDEESVIRDFFEKG